MSTFGRVFRVTTYGESHSKGVGVIIDGVPPQLALTESDIQPQLTRRRPGQSRITTPRSEADIVTIYSGTEHGYTLGTPIGLLVLNKNVRPGDYSEMRKIPRPGHADYTYISKYGTHAASGGGRSSARETIGRVAAGAVAEKWLRLKFGCEISSWVASIGGVSIPQELYGKFFTRNEVDTKGRLRVIRPKKWRLHQASTLDSNITNGHGGVDKEKLAQAQLETDAASEVAFLEGVRANDNNAPEFFSEDAEGLPAYLCWDGTVRNALGKILPGETKESTESKGWLTPELIPVRCPIAESACQMATLIRIIKSHHDSIGGTVHGQVRGVPPCLGEPVFDKLEGTLAHAMLSLPATKGFEIGSGFRGTKMRGSQHNDKFKPRQVEEDSNNNGNDSKATNEIDEKKKQVCNLEVRSNNAGGTLGGITSGADLCFRVAVKPVSTIGQSQETAGFDGIMTKLAARGRHDPCVLPRTPPLIEGMTALCVADAAMLQLARVMSMCPPEDLEKNVSEKKYVTGIARHIGQSQKKRKREATVE
eukprot:g1246.t1